jgi:hypothetical protein
MDAKRKPIGSVNVPDALTLANNMVEYPINLF